MTRYVLPFVAFLLTAMLAGCAEDPQPQEGSQDPRVITDPSDYSYLDGTTDGSGWHVHDYWRGQDRLVIVNSTANASSSCSGCQSAMMFGRGIPPEGTTVPQGTRWINGTFSGELTMDGVMRLELWMRTAEDTEAKWVKDIRLGEPFSVEISNDQNDPPHQVLSGFEFYAMAMARDSSMRISGEHHFFVEAVRGWEVPAWPPHPDHWNGATQLVVMADSGSSMLTLYEDHGGGSYSITCFSGCPTHHRPGNDLVVPIETGEVQVRIEYGPGLPMGLGLRYHGADTRSWTEATGEQELGATVFRIPVEPRTADSPYAKQSLWEFWVYLDGPLDHRAWSGSYEITATAHKRV